MAHAAMVDTYLQRLLDGMYGEDLTVLDDLYILPLTAQPRVNVVPGQGHALRVQVAAAVAESVTPTPELFAALNDVNAALPYGRVFLVDEFVVAEHTVPGDELTTGTLTDAVRFVCWVVDAHGADLVAEFGGTTATEPQATLPLGTATAEVRDAVQPVTDTPDEVDHDGGRVPVDINVAGYL